TFTATRYRMTMFRGPYADLPPSEALAVDIPSLTAFGWPELRRMCVTTLELTVAVVVAVARHALALATGRRPAHGWIDAYCLGLVDGFERLGPSWVKTGQMIASSPG